MATTSIVRTRRRDARLVTRVAALLIASFCLASAALAGEITVHATGVAYGAPDEASMVVGFTTTSGDVAGALAEADDVIARVRRALEEAGVDPLDVRTVTFSVWREERFDDGPRPEAAAVVYRVTHHLEVIVRDVDAVGALLTIATDAGANHVGGIDFRVRDARELEAEARRNAYAAALDKGEQLAGLAGTSLGAPIDIVEALAGAPVGGPEARGMAMFDAAPVAGGRLAVEVWIEVTFATEP